MTGNDIALLGAPDMLLGTPQAKSKAVQAMHFTMTNEILEELLDCVKSGKPPQILFGSKPAIRYNGRSLELESRLEKHRHELYADDGEQENEWSFAGVINHSLAVQPAAAEDPAGGVDLALETLKTRMAAEREEREANKAIISTPELQPKSRSFVSSRRNVLKPASFLSRTSSPALLPASSPSYLSPPRSAPLDKDMTLSSRDPALRRALVLFLSSEPRSVKDCRVVAGAPRQSPTANDRTIKDALKTIAMCNDPTNVSAKWSLLDKSYKELKPFEKFTWPSSEMREKAVDNAIRSFDRMRISKDDPLWQSLLPKDERGQGIVLSRLKLQDGPSHPKPAATAPAKYDRKTGLPKKTADSKKSAEKKDKKDDKPKVDKAAAAKGSEKPAKEAKAVAKPTPKSTPAAKPAKPLNANGLAAAASPALADAAPRPRSTGNLSTSSQAAAAREPIKTAKVAKALVNKPKNPSPLSKSPPVNASDFGSDHPVHKKLSAGVSPAKKRKADELELDSQRNGVPAAKRQHLRTPSATERPKAGKASTTSGSSAEREKETSLPKKNMAKNGAAPSLKRKAADSLDSDSSKQSTPSKVRKTEAPPPPRANGKPNGTHNSFGYSKPGGAMAPKLRSPDTEASSSSSSSSDDSRSLKLTWKQALEMALRYEQYYPHYKKLFLEISSADHAPTAAKREQLQKMHNKLKLMKDQIADASWRGKDGKGLGS